MEYSSLNSENYWLQNLMITFIRIRFRIRLSSVRQKLENILIKFIPHAPMDSI